MTQKTREIIPTMRKLINRPGVAVDSMTDQNNLRGRLYFGSVFLRLQPTVAGARVLRQKMMAIRACWDRISSPHYEQERRQEIEGRKGDREGRETGRGVGGRAQGLDSPSPGPRTALCFPTPVPNP